MNMNSNVNNSERAMTVLGIDIGGSGIKGALVDVEQGTLATERHRIPTPENALPDDVARVVAEIAQHFAWQGPIGCTFPAVVKRGVAYSAANIDSSWIGTDVAALLQQQTGCPVTVTNDADAAGIAEMAFGAGKGHKGIVFVLTLGTGIGSAVFVRGHLLPNTELGHLEIRGKEAEHRASDQVRKQKEWDWDKWTEKLNEYLQHLEMLFSPDLFILSGGVSKKHEKYLHLLDTRASIVPAHLLNNAGIVGAALAASRQEREGQ
jgi:polyphosphate glucokinase